MKNTIYIILLKRKKYIILLLYVDNLLLIRDIYKNIKKNLNIYKVNIKV